MIPTAEAIPAADIAAARPAPFVHRVAIAGLGAIGKVVAAKIDAGMPGLVLTAAAARDPLTQPATLTAM